MYGLWTVDIAVRITYIHKKQNNNNKGIIGHDLRTK